MITWQDFENTVANPKNSFEDLSRIFFKYHYKCIGEQSISSCTLLFFGNTA